MLILQILIPLDILQNFVNIVHYHDAVKTPIILARSILISKTEQVKKYYEGNHLLDSGLAI
ncbi:MAG: hypothetical protein ACFE96_06720 [Candidatus Hermodarchaeota archaeon]